MARASSKVRWLVVAILAIHAGLLTFAATRHSPNLNEPAHLAAGISHWHFGRFDLYRVNPPLVRMVAALPVLLANPKTDWSAYYEGPGARPEFEIGRDFMSANGERSFWLFFIARWACIPFSLLGGFVCYRWASDLFGPKSGIMALVLWCFDPTVMGHAEFITPDVGATAVGLAANYLFWRWLRVPTWPAAIAAGLTLGLAELTKSTWIVLFGLWPVLFLTWRLADQRLDRTVAGFPRQACQMVSMFALALYVLNLGYGFEGSFERLGRYEFVSAPLAGRDTNGNAIRGGNRFRGTFLARVPVPLPRNYVLGIDSQKESLDDSGQPSYLRGVISEHGWWYYYLYALAIKVPLGTWGLVALGAALSVVSGIGWRNSRVEDHSAEMARPTAWRDMLVLLSPAFLILVFVSSQTGFSRHLRYVLPCFPYVFIAISHVFAALPKSAATRPPNSHSDVPSDGPIENRRFRHSRKTRILIVTHRTATLACAIWSVTSCLWFFPHGTAYFNELMGGPLQGHEHLLSSNLDWGQDLLSLKRWFDDHPNARPFRMAYYGAFDPRIADLQFELPLRRPASRHDTESRDYIEDRPTPGWYAVSVTFVRGIPYPAYGAKGNRHFLERGQLAYFDRFAPIDHVGYSIAIYHVGQSIL